MIMILIGGRLLASTKACAVTVCEHVLALASAGGLEDHTFVGSFNHIPIPTFHRYLVRASSDPLA